MSANAFATASFGSNGTAGTLVKPTAAFPGRVAGDADLAIAVNRLQTRLALPMSASDTSMTVLDPSLVAAFSLLSIDSEIVKVTGAPTGNVIPVSRGFDGTAAALHLASATVSGFIDAWHHNALAAEVEAIEQALGPNLSGIATSPLIVATDYAFTPIVSGSGVTVPGGNLIAGANVLTFAQIPKGVNGTDRDHYLYISGGTGTPEGAKINGGSGVAGQPGQLIVTCANTHSGAWSVASGSGGIGEACVVANSRGGGIIIVPSGTYMMQAPVRVFSYTTMIGMGIYSTQLYRSRDYGSTFVIGTSTAGDNNISFENLWLYHDLGYTAGAPPTVLNPPTTGAHVLLQGGNIISFRRCRFQDHVYGIDIVGGAQINIDDCIFAGVWSPGFASGQVTQSDIHVWQDSARPALGLPTYVKIRGCALIGSRQGPTGQAWGSRARLLVNAVEDLEVLGGAMAAAGGYNIQLLPSTNTLANVRITAGVRFDGAVTSDINITGDGTGSAGNVMIAGCMFNGQTLGATYQYSSNAISIASSTVGIPSVIGLEISDNVIFDYQATAVMVQDGYDFNISDNVIYMYNLGANSASSLAAGIFVGPRANNGLIQGNLVGGDNTGNSAYGVNNNKCLFGIVIQDPAVAQAAVTVVDNYPPFLTAIGTATDQIFSTRVARVVFFVDTEAGANNALVATMPNVPVIRGLRIALYLQHTLQVGANTLNFNGSGAKAIKSSRNPNNNIAVGYIVTGVISLLYDGTQWLDLSQ